MERPFQRVAEPARIDACSAVRLSIGRILTGLRRARERHDSNRWQYPRLPSNQRAQPSDRRRCRRRPPMNEPHDLLTTAEVALILRAPVSTVRYWR